MLGAAAGYVALWSVYKLFKLITARKGWATRLQAACRDRRVAGWQLLPVVILLSAVVGSIVGLALIAFAGRSSQQPFRSGRTLRARASSLYVGERLVQLYEAWFFR